MLTTLCRRLAVMPRAGYSFATATRDSVDYYSLLEVESGATEKDIRSSFTAMTTGLIPEKDPQRYR